MRKRAPAPMRNRCQGLAVRDTYETAVGVDIMLRDGLGRKAVLGSCVGADAVALVQCCRCLGCERVQQLVVGTDSSSR